MKTKITITLLAIFSLSLNLFAGTDEPDSMYIHFTATDNSDSIVAHAIADVDSIVYYAPVLPTVPQGIDWDTATEGVAQANALTDADGNSYSAVKIGTQVWMAENLKASQYADGTAIDSVPDNTAWGNLDDNDTDKAYCAYNNDANNESDTYGYLYTYAAATNGDNSGSAVQGVCPTGWHLPSDTEWTDLKIYLTGDNKGSQLASNAALWTDGTLEQATEFGSSDFAALPGGYRFNIGTFYHAGYCGYWWSSSEYSSSKAYGRDIIYINSGVNHIFTDKSVGFSVRCVRD